MTPEKSNKISKTLGVTLATLYFSFAGCSRETPSTQDQTAVRRVEPSIHKRREITPRGREIVRRSSLFNEQDNSDPIINTSFGSFKFKNSDIPGINCGPYHIPPLSVIRARYRRAMKKVSQFLQRVSNIF